MNKLDFPLVMGIVNINEESFFEGSRCVETEEVWRRIETMVENGAKIIDLGGCSTRPGSVSVSLEQEWNYLEKPLQILKGKDLKGALISIDTFRSEVVARAYNIIGQFIVNDVSAGEDDDKMLQLVGELGLPYIAMHKRGNPQTMGQLCDYPNGVTEEVIRYFKEFHIKAQRYNIKNYIIDPGFGFAKTIEQNYELLRDTKYIKESLLKINPNTKILIGLSRKVMIWR